MAIYTRGGDTGTTALFSGQRVSKAHPRVEAYGTLDELNAALSLCHSASSHAHQRALLEAIQRQLFYFGAELASEEGSPSCATRRRIESADIDALERAIDEAMSQVASRPGFILPGRCETASRLHFARTLARRAERRLVALTTQADVRPTLLRYLNRLSDCLYALARVADHQARQQAIIHEVVRRYRAALPTSPPANTALAFQQRHQLISAAVARAQALRVAVVISLVDADGTLAVTWRMPDALLVSSELAPKKAWSAVALKKATHQLADEVQPGAPLYGLASQMQGKVVTFGGGYPLWRDGQLLGGLGVSGGSVEQDMDIAQAAIAALNWGAER